MCIIPFDLIMNFKANGSISFLFFFFNFQRGQKGKSFYNFFFKKSGTHFSITLIHANETTLIHFLIKGNLLYSAGEKYMNTRLNAPSRLKEKLKDLRLRKDQRLSFHCSFYCLLTSKRLLSLS